MKKYEKPDVNEIELSSNDIIQTSAPLIPEEGSGPPIKWNLTSDSDATGNVFQK